MISVTITALAAEIADGYYRLQNNTTSNYMSVNGSYWTVPIVQAFNASSLQQVWRITSDGNGGYLIRNCFTGLYYGHQSTTAGWMPMQNAPRSFYATANGMGNAYAFNCTADATDATTNAISIRATSGRDWVQAAARTSTYAWWKLTEVTGDMATKAAQNLANAEFDDSKIYRIKSVTYPQRVARVTFADKNVSTDMETTGDVRQYWKLAMPDGYDAYTIQSLYSQKHIQDNTTNSSYFTMGDAQQEFVLIKNGNKPTEKVFSIGRGRTKIAYGAGDWVNTGLHCSQSQGYNVVLWNFTSDASMWTFEEATDADADAITEAQEDYSSRTSLIENANSYTNTLMTVFADSACTTLKDEYASATDGELTTALAGLPTAIISHAIKVKNNAWANWEKEFRIQAYKAYSDPRYWARVLNTSIYGRYDNPTGIVASSSDSPIYMYVEKVPANCQLYVETMNDQAINVYELAKELKPGLNVFFPPTDTSQIYIRYWSADSSLLADYPKINIHIEGGKVTGYFDINKFTNADWTQMKTDGLFTHKYIDVLGNYVQWHIFSYIPKEHIVNDKIVETMTCWDNIEKLQLSIAGLIEGEEGVYEDLYPKRFNNHMMCRNSLNGSMDAANYRTQYPTSGWEILSLNYEPQAGQAADYTIRNGQNVWGMAHEIGHMNQGAINTAGATEVSNNLFSEACVWNSGNTTSRLQNIKLQAPYLAQKSNWLTMAGGGFTPTGEKNVYYAGWRTRMYFNLYLYFHVLGNDTLFFPKVFRAMRRDPMDMRATISGNDNYLKLARVMANVAHMNLNDYFTYWGFFTPIENENVHCYSTWNVTTTQEDIDNTKAYIAAQGPSNGAMIFIDDRVTQVPRADGVAGYRLPYRNDNSSSIKAQGPLTMGDIQLFAEKPEPTGYEFDIDERGHVTIPDAAEGACGIKIYDKNGTLAYVAATDTFTLPAWLINEGGYTIKIQKYDGTDVLCKTVSGQAVHVDEDQYSTFYTDEDFIMPEGISGGIVTEVNDNSITIEYAYNEGDIVPANTGLILKGKYGISNYQVPETSGQVAAPAVNYLKGTIAKTAITAREGYTYYKFSYNSSGENLGFYWGADGGGSFVNGAHKAYLELPGTLAKKYLAINETVTGISEIGGNSLRTSLNGNTKMYNMQGQQVDNSYRGIVIVGGKKIIK